MNRARALLLGCALSVLPASAGDLARGIETHTPQWQAACTELGLAAGSARHRLCVIHMRVAYIDGVTSGLAVGVAAPLPPPPSMICTRMADDRLHCD